MAATIPNIAKGKINEYAARVKANDPANSALVIVLLQATLVSTLDQLRDMDTLAAILAVETEATFTNYARIVLTDADITAPTPDDTGNLQAFDLPDQTITAAGGTLDNTIDAMVIGYDSDTTAGTDANIVPAYVLVPTTGVATNGEDFHIRFPSGLWSADEV